MHQIVLNARQLLSLHELIMHDLRDVHTYVCIAVYTRTYMQGCVIYTEKYQGKTKGIISTKAHMQCCMVLALTHAHACPPNVLHAIKHFDFLMCMRADDTIGING